MPFSSVVTELEPFSVRDVEVSFVTIEATLVVASLAAIVTVTASLLKYQGALALKVTSSPFAVTDSITGAVLSLTTSAVTGVLSLPALSMDTAVNV